MNMVKCGNTYVDMDNVVRIYWEYGDLYVIPRGIGEGPHAWGEPVDYALRVRKEYEKDFVRYLNEHSYVVQSDKG